MLRTFKGPKKEVVDRDEIPSLITFRCMYFDLFWWNKTTSWYLTPDSCFCMLLMTLNVQVRKRPPCTIKIFKFFFVLSFYTEEKIINCKKKKQNNDNYTTLFIKITYFDPVRKSFWLLSFITNNVSCAVLSIIANRVWTNRWWCWW